MDAARALELEDVEPDVRETDGPSMVLPGQTPEGEHILSVLVKRTFDIIPGGACERAEADEDLVPADAFHEDPGNSSVELESDFAPFKLATDVVLNGRAYAPGGRPVPWLEASLSVGDHRKKVLVIGDRKAIYQDGAPPAFTEPEPFTEMDLRYERAYGGTDIYSDPQVPCTYPRNPVGKGFVVANDARAVEGLELPNLERASELLSPSNLFPGHFMHWEKQPFPWSFGWFPRIWRPRALLAGVMPADREAERELRAAYSELVPEEQRELYRQTELPDMDFRFFNGASPGLIVPYLAGDEEVVTENLSPEGIVSFRLPGEVPHIGLDLGAGVQEPEVVLHTVMIRMEEGQVDLVWRGAVPFEGPDTLPELEKMEVLVA